jgi:uncharacterized protein (DUF2147 family)
VTVFKIPGIVATMALASLLSISSAAQAKDVAGVWLSDDGEGAVEIQPCGDKRCGRLVWLKTPLDNDGRPLVDANNPEPALRKRPVCGIDIIKDVALQSDGSWDGGSVYDPEEGKVYSVMLKAKGNESLEVTGYLGIKALGETLTWTRAPAQLKRCQPDATSKAK